MCEKTVFPDRAGFMNQPRLGFFCDLGAKLGFVSDLIFCKIFNLYSLISTSFLSAFIKPFPGLRVIPYRGFGVVEAKPLCGAEHTSGNPCLKKLT